MLTATQTISIVVFTIVMILVVTEKIHRTIAALLGAVALLVIGVIDFNSGIESIDFNTLGVLCGMMLFVSCIKESGLFEYVAIKAAKICKGNPRRLLAAFCIITAGFSALLDNVTTILLVGPMTIMLCRILKIDATPFLIAEILSSNIGGTATLIGDPPNIMIGSAAGYSFADFIHYDTPVAIICMAAVILIFEVAFGRKLAISQSSIERIMDIDEKTAIKNSEGDAAGILEDGAFPR